MHFSKLSKGQYLFMVNQLFTNSISDDEIRNAVGEFGYSEKKLAEGKRLYEDLDAIASEHNRKIGEKSTLHIAKQNKQKAVNRLYMKYLKIARIAFVDNVEAKNALLLDGVRERTYKKWYFQVHVFCSNLLENKEFLPFMESYGVSVTHIQDLKKQLNELSELTDKSMKLTGMVRMLTQKKQKQTLEVQNWVSDYIKIARIALEDAPQNLQKIGINVRN